MLENIRCNFLPKVSQRSQGKNMTKGLFLFCLDLDLIKGIVAFCCLCTKVFSLLSKLILQATRKMSFEPYPIVLSNVKFFLMDNVL